MDLQQALKRQVEHLKETARKIRYLNGHVHCVGLTGIESTLDSIQLELLNATEELSALIDAVEK